MFLADFRFLSFFFSREISPQINSTWIILPSSQILYWRIFFLLPIFSSSLNTFFQVNQHEEIFNRVKPRIMKSIYIAKLVLQNTTSEPLPSGHINFYRGSRSVVFHSGQKMALGALYVEICSEVLWVFTMPCKNMNILYSIRMYWTNFWQPT